MGQYHLLAYAELWDIELAGVVDSDRERAAHVAAYYDTRPLVDHRDLIGWSTWQASPCRPSSTSRSPPTSWGRAWASSSRSRSRPRSRRRASSSPSRVAAAPC